MFYEKNNALNALNNEKKCYICLLKGGMYPMMPFKHL